MRFHCLGFITPGSGYGQVCCDSPIFRIPATEAIDSSNISKIIASLHRRVAGIRSVHCIRLIILIGLLVLWLDHTFRHVSVPLIRNLPLWYWQILFDPFTNYGYIVCSHNATIGIIPGAQRVFRVLIPISIMSVNHCPWLSSIDRIGITFNQTR